MVQVLTARIASSCFTIDRTGQFHTTALGNSTKSIACNSKWEMDHLEASEGFRSGSTISLVTCRVSLIDSMNEISS